MAQMTAPESVVRAIFAAAPSPSRARVLASLGLAEDGTAVGEELRASAIAELVQLHIPAEPDPEDIPEPAINLDEVPY